MKNPLSSIPNVTKKMIACGLSLTLIVTLSPSATAADTAPFTLTPVTLTPVGKPITGPLTNPSIMPTITPTESIRLESCGTTPAIIKAFGPCRPTIAGSYESRGLFKQELSQEGEAVRRKLEADAAQATLELHKLPPSDLNKVQRNARASMRAALFALIDELFKKDPTKRTAGEQDLVKAYESLVRDFRVLSARYAKAEYDKWASNRCGYKAPAEPEYKPDIACLNRQLAVAVNPAPPSLEAFTSYGVTLAYKNLGLADKDATTVAANMANATLGWAALGTTAGAAGIAAAVAAATTFEVLLSASGTLTFVYGTVGLPKLIATLIPATAGIYGVGTTGASVAIFASAVAGSVAAIAAAIVIGVMRGITVVKEAQMPVKLDEAIRTAENQSTPIQSELSSTDASARANALGELYTIFTYSTLPESHDRVAPPSPSEGDPKFLIKDDKNNELSNNASSISFMTSGKRDQTGSARLSGGWLVSQYKQRDEMTPQDLTLSILYVDWNGNLKSAERAGSKFNVIAIDAKPVTSEVLNSIKYLDENGVKKEAMIR